MPLRDSCMKKSDKHCRWTWIAHIGCVIHYCLLKVLYGDMNRAVILWYIKKKWIVSMIQNQKLIFISLLLHLHLHYTLHYNTSFITHEHNTYNPNSKQVTLSAVSHEKQTLRHSINHPLLSTFLNLYNPQAPAAPYQSMNYLNDRLALARS